MTLIDRAKSWVEHDPDPVTKAELDALISSGNTTELEDRFMGLLQFGTAGLRGELGAGPNRMNRVVVGYAALAIAQFLKANRAEYLDPDGDLSVVIGYDGRENSDIFARDTAQILAGNGVKALIFETRVPTPVAAFTGRRLGSSATIVVTASHNPPRDNGYKVYLGGRFGGSQLISPQDREIAELISNNYQTLKFSEIAKSEDFSPLSMSDIELYVERAISLIEENNPSRNSLRITHTSLHGVGWPVVKEIFERTGYKISPVESQMIPDSNFPTVSFPNPEEPGAMDLAYEVATKNQSDLILANDPDADRLAVAIPVNGKWRMLTGDEVGLILADYCAARASDGALANSIVSADISKVASNYSLNYQQTLTGFKWISKVPNLVFGYEEALGYCVDPSHTPDKDGITAALLIAEIATNLKREGKNLADHLLDLFTKYGEVSTGQVSIRVSDLSVIGKVMAKVRDNPPKEFEGELEVTDLLKSDSMRTDAVILQNQKVRMIFRPSGTEPKLKCYLQYQGNTDGLSRLKSFATAFLNSAQ